MGIRFENLAFSYSDDLRPVVDGLDGAFSRSEVTILTGASGCGKSTLLYLAAGLYPGSAGTLRSGCVEVDGKELRKLQPPQRARIAGMMFQNPDLQFCMDTVRN